MTESRFGMTELDDLPEDLRERIGEIARKSGFVPNIFRALGHRPAELRAFLDYHDALMDSSEGLTKAERELVVVATSAANHCTYCIVAHGAILRGRRNAFTTGTPARRSDDSQLGLLPADTLAVRRLAAALRERCRVS